MGLSILKVIVVLAAAIWLAGSFFYTVFAFDDAFIVFRYVENIHRGWGAVFNPGERVEGYSCPLFVLLLAGFRALGAPPLHAATGINLAAALGCVVLAAAWAHELPREPSRARAAAVVAGALVAGHPSIVRWVFSGMDILPFAFLSFLTLYLLRHPATSRRRALAVAGAAAAAALTRPEGAIVVAGAAAVMLWDHRRHAVPFARSPLAVFAAATALLLGAALAVRVAYYGAWLPNVYYAKIVAMSVKRLARGVEYVVTGQSVFFVGPLLLAPLVTGRRPRDDRAWWLGLLALGASSFFAVWAGGDWMGGQRFLVPALPLAAVLWGRCLVSIWGKLRRPDRSPATLVAFLAAAAFGLGATALCYLHDVRGLHRSAVPFTRAHAALGEWLERNTPPETIVAIGAVGAVGYYGHRRIVDCWGLTDAFIARHGKKAPERAPGHQAYDGRYVWDRKPGLVFLLNDFTPEPLSEDEYLARALSDRELSSHWARELTAQPGFDRLYAYRVFEVADGVWFGGYVRQEGEGALR